MKPLRYIKASLNWVPIEPICSVLAQLSSIVKTVTIHLKRILTLGTYYKHLHMMTHRPKVRDRDLPNLVSVSGDHCLGAFIREFGGPPLRKWYKESRLCCGGCTGTYHVDSRLFLILIGADVWWWPSSQSASGLQCRCPAPSLQTF